MSRGTLNKTKEPLEEPHRHIGAQDLLKQRDSVSHSGFLRKRGKLERIVGSNGLFTAIFSELSKWRQRFVIIGRGCLYVYADEHGRSPLQAVSLRGYSRVERPPEGMGLEEVTRRCFRIIPSDESTMKTFVFGCAKDGERKEWMKNVRMEMQLANSKTNEQQLPGMDLDDYVALERPVIEQIIKETRARQGNVPRRKPPKTPDSDDSESDAESDYDRITDDVVQKIRGKPLPDIPKEEKVTRRPAKPQKPQYLTSKDVDPNEYLFDGSDRTKAINILSNRASGTFLVRKSRAGDQQVLSVQTDDGMKEYKIYEKPAGLTIDNKSYFPTVEKLIENYKRMTLPNRATTLSRGFSVSEEQQF
uniref:SH3 domain-binding protein 2-like n=1 Tax=Crassostrea virginica TaxID=6565 RepID=A0A8B8AHP9_CRAVI|nr:SH3 domain-binding protein 2-like [Crassostrea virginica]